ncbi:MAG: hypothetical protein RLZZ226_1573 [Pseudomonadota bacterium]|jgi:hypothetical protein
MQHQEYLAMIDSVTHYVGVSQALQQNKIIHEQEISALKLSNDLMQKDDQVEVETLDAVDQVSSIEEEGSKINIRV